MIARADQGKSLVLSGNEGAIIVETADKLTASVDHLLSTAGYPNNYAITRSDKNGFLIELADNSILYPNVGDIGFIFRSHTYDSFKRPVMWICGSTLAGIELAAKWAVEKCLDSITSPETYPNKPLEIIIIPAEPYLSENPWSLCTNHLKAVIRCGDLEYDYESATWKSHVRRCKVVVTYVGATLVLMTVDGRVIARGAKFSLLTILIRAALESAHRCVTLEEAQIEIDDASFEGEAVKGRIKILSTRIGELRAVFPSLIQEGGDEGKPNYRLIADIQVVKK